MYPDRGSMRVLRQKRALHDPKAAFRREFFDLAWTTAALGWQVWLEPQAVVIYKKAQPVKAEDIMYFMARRGDEICYGSQLHLNRKWGIAYVTDRWHEQHRDEQLVGTRLCGAGCDGTAPADRLTPLHGMTGGAHKARLVVCLLIAVGYNRFRVAHTSASQATSSSPQTAEGPAGSYNDANEGSDWRSGIQMLQDLPTHQRSRGVNDHLEAMEFFQQRGAPGQDDPGRTGAQACPAAAHPLGPHAMPGAPFSTGSALAAKVPPLHRLVSDGALPEHRIDWIEDAVEAERHFTRQARKQRDPFSRGAMLSVILDVLLDQDGSCAARLRPHACLELLHGEGRAGDEAHEPSAARMPASRELWFWLRDRAAEDSHDIADRMSSLLGASASVEVPSRIELPAEDGSPLGAGRPALLRWAYMPLGGDGAQQLLRAAARPGWSSRLRAIAARLSRPKSATLRVSMELRNADGKALPLEYTVLPTGLARRWFKELCRVHSQQLPLKYNDRIYNFHSNPQRSLLAAWARLRTCAERIEAWRCGTVPELSAELGVADPFRELFAGGEPVRQVVRLQERLNVLHKRFEIMRGSIERPGKTFQDAPLDLREAIQDYNLLIHRIESMLPFYIPWRSPPSPTVVAAFDHRRRRVKLRRSEMREFHLRLEFGCLYLNYCEVGKHVLEAYQDRDTVVGVANLRPQAHLSADAKAFFGADWGPSRSEGTARELRAWWDAHGLAAATGRAWGDPALALGYAPVARLDRRCPALLGLDDEAVVAAIACHPTLHSLCPR